MKHFNLLFFVLAAGLLMTSCKKEDAKKSPETQIQGKWKGQMKISTLMNNGKVVESDTTFILAPDYLTADFKKNNQCVISQSFDNDVESENLFYKLEKDKIFVAETDQYLNSEINFFEINGKKLVLKSTKEVEGDGNWEALNEMHFSK